MTSHTEQTLSSVFLVRSEHLNHEGHLFGGDLMAEIDTTAYCLLRRIYGDKAFVTRAAEIQFEKPADLGDAITFRASMLKVGTTSVQVRVVGLVSDEELAFLGERPLAERVFRRLRRPVRRLAKRLGGRGSAPGSGRPSVRRKRSRE